MPVHVANAIADLRMAPEVLDAMQAVQRPEVQALMKELSKYNLGVCVPHMHSRDVDFANLPTDTVQIEENGMVRWVGRDELDTIEGHVPVAWRWTSDGVVEDVECIKTCTPNPTKGHRSGHL